MLISEFIEQNQINNVVNPHVVPLITQCLTGLHLVYGCDTNWNNPDNWMFEELERDVTNLKITPDHLLESVNQSTTLMSNDITKSLSCWIEKTKQEPLGNKPIVKQTGNLVESILYSQQIDKEWELKHLQFKKNKSDIRKTTASMKQHEIHGLFNYTDKPLFKINGEIISDTNYYLIPLLLGMNELVKMYDQENPSIGQIIKVTKLIESSNQIQMLTQINLLWMCESEVNKT